MWLAICKEFKASINTDESKYTNKQLNYTIMKELLNNRFTMTIIIIIVTTLLYVTFGTYKQDTIHEIVSMLGRGLVIILAIVSEILVISNHEY